MRILVVDDEPMLAELTKFELEQEGFQADTVISVDEAELYLQSEKCDAVLSDIRMPQRTGLDLVQLIAAHYPHLLVVLITGYSQISAEDIEYPNFRGILNKPFDILAFKALLQQKQ